MQSLRPYICPFEVLTGLVSDGDSVLDIGCGSGLFLGLLASSGRGVRGLGLDASAPAVQAAAEMAARLARTGTPGSLEFRRAASFEDWPAAVFDVVAVIDVLHHVAPAGQIEFMKQACRRVRPGGILLYKDIARRPRWKALANRLHDLAIAGDWIHYCDLAQVALAVRSCGLLERERRIIDRLWYRHELVVFSLPLAG